MDHGSMVPPEFMVLADDIVDMVNHYMEGIPVTEKTLALDTIDKVSPGSHYLQQEHTRQHFRKVKYSRLFDRTTYEIWKMAGAITFEERLQQLTLEKMGLQAEPLPEEVVKELDKMQANWK
jgi:trimethylamine--corrinoid protein Co-methyltransferase